MLDHPWLRMDPNYDYKLTDKEFEIMMMKKQMKNKFGGQKKKQEEEEEQIEMNELIDSDQELYAADQDVGVI